MAGLYRLIFGVVLLLVGVSANALVPTQSQWRYDVNGTKTAYAATKDAACLSASPLVDAYVRTLGYTGGGRSVYEGTTCQIYSRVGTQPEAKNGSLPAEGGAASCPANSTAVTGGCQCTSPYVENAGKTACEAPNPCASLAGKDAGDMSWNGGPITGNPIRPDYTYCDGWQQQGNGKCTATARRDASFGVDGNWINQGRATYTGNLASGTCNGDGGTGTTPTESVKPPGTDPVPPVKPPEGQAAPSPCPQGQAPGEVNGTRVCAERGPETPVQGNDSKEVKDPNGSSTTTSGTTTCKDGKCVRDETVCTKASAGATPSCSGATTTTTGQGEFCAANAGNKVCQGEGSGGFGGDCVAGFKATGEDAVLNAMALEQHKRNCEFLAKTSPEATLINAQSDPAGTTKASNPNDSTVNIGAGNFDTSSAIGGGGCALNKTITVAGRSATLPFNVLCDPLAVLGQLLVVVSLLAAARIVARG